jgi:hypothetical protein
MEIVQTLIDVQIAGHFGEEVNVTYRRALVDFQLTPWYALDTDRAPLSAFAIALPRDGLVHLVPFQFATDILQMIQRMFLMDMATVIPQILALARLHGLHQNVTFLFVMVSLRMILQYVQVGVFALLQMFAPLAVHFGLDPVVNCRFAKDFHPIIPKFALVEVLVYHQMFALIVPLDGLVSIVKCPSVMA